jgi:hypothetical protein
MNDFLSEYEKQCCIALEKYHDANHNRLVVSRALDEQICIISDLQHSLHQRDHLFYQAALESFNCSQLFRFFGMGADSVVLSSTARFSSLSNKFAELQHDFSKVSADSTEQVLQIDGHHYPL